METDNDNVEENILLFLILNGKDAAGFSNIIEEADISDGFMDIVLIKNCLHIDLAALFFNDGYILLYAVDLLSARVSFGDQRNRKKKKFSGNIYGNSIYFCGQFCN